MAGRSPAQLVALVFGAVYALVGVLGFFADPSFGVGAAAASTAVDQLIIFAVNGWHNIVHLAIGAIGLAVAGSWAGARAYCIAIGAAYALVFILGLLMDPVIGLVPINAPDNVLHLLSAVVFLGAGLATPSQPAPRTA